MDDGGRNETKTETETETIDWKELKQTHCGFLENLSFSKKPSIVEKGWKWGFKNG